jgi:hypothetical protein
MLSLIVDAVMLVEALIFDGDECLRHILRKEANRDTGPQLLPYLADERAVACEDLGRLRLRHDLPGLACLVFLPS